MSITAAMATEDTPSACKKERVLEASAVGEMLLYTACAEEKRGAVSHAMTAARQPCISFVEK